MVMVQTGDESNPHKNVIANSLMRGNSQVNGAKQGQVLFVCGENIGR